MEEEAQLGVFFSCEVIENWLVTVGLSCVSFLFVDGKG